MARSKGCLGPTVPQTMRRTARRRRRVSPDDDDDDGSWWRTNKLIGGAPGAADDQTVNTETTGTRRQAQQQEEEDDDDDGIDWSKMPPEEVFKRFDTDGSGEIDLEEFKVMLKKLKIQMSSAKAVKYFKMCDVLTQCLFLRFSELQVRVDGVSATSRHRDAVGVAVRESTRLVSERRRFCDGVVQHRSTTRGRSTLKNFGSRCSRAIRTTATRSASLPTRC